VSLVRLWSLAFRSHAAGARHSISSELRKDISHERPLNSHQSLSVFALVWLTHKPLHWINVFELLTCYFAAFHGTFSHVLSGHYNQCILLQTQLFVHSLMLSPLSWRQSVSPYDIMTIMTIIPQCQQFQHSKHGYIVQNSPFHQSRFMRNRTLQDGEHKTHNVHNKYFWNSCVVLWIPFTANQ